MKRLLPLIPLLFLLSCGQARRQQAAEPAPLAVRTVAVMAVSWPVTYEVSGTVRPRSSATISSKLMATVQRVLVEPGDRVKRGQLLVLLDSRASAVALERTEAMRAEADSAITEANDAAAAAKANLDLAQVTFDRMRKLAAERSVTRQELDEAAAKQASAQAAYAEAMARKKQSESRLKRSEQELVAARLVREQTSLYAPFTGLVVAKSVQPGDLALPGSPLVTLESGAGYRLEINVDESSGQVARTGDSVFIALDEGGCQGSARVSEVAPLVDPSSRSYVVKLDLPPNCMGIRSGVFGRATLAAAARQTLAIPFSAVVEHGQLQSVIVPERDRARLRLVTTGLRRGNEIEIVSGLQAGENVVSPISAQLTDGAPIVVSGPGAAGRP